MLYDSLLRLLLLGRYVPVEILVQVGNNMSCTHKNCILWLFSLGQHDFHRDAGS